MEEEESKMEREKEWVELELPLGDATETFELEKVVCSHGFFMMTPNIWDPLSKSLLRPLRLRLDDYDENDVGDASLSSVMVRISQPHDRPQCLLVRVRVEDRSLSARQKQTLLVTFDYSFVLFDHIAPFDSMFRSNGFVVTTFFWFDCRLRYRECCACVALTRGLRGSFVFYGKVRACVALH